ncbi:hypothetical protein [Paenibacillus tepidiphilus]|uniref:hypothetical protein n=1 Tax=Paenibacillus tepidiphilus TaxID=2608683 RepID=UPI00123983AB|nr:hypothetical protein [Paenibacillus tepidiphilus]
MYNKHKVTALAAVCVLSAVMLAGCRELPHKEAVDNQFQERLSGFFGELQPEGLSPEINGDLEEAGATMTDTAHELGDQLGVTGE